MEALRRAWDAGEAVLPVDQRLSPTARAALLSTLAPAAVIDAGGRTALSGARPVEPGDALVMATSGTTGNPKGVVLTHAAVEASARATSARLQVDPDRHRWLACLPLNHVGGLSVLTRSICTGTACTVLPGFDEEAVRRASGPDVLVSLVATALQRTPAGLFRTVVLGGSTPPADLAENVVTTYGLTETGSGVVYDGVALEGVEVQLAPGSGEVRLRCPMLLRCYRDETVPLDRDGWFSTGDIGRWDAAGRLQIAGRMTDMIISGGENIWPAPVEEVLRLHPGVAEVAVAGRPDPEWGQRVVAWVVPADPADPPTLEELRNLVGERLARFAAPRQLVLATSLPRTSIGKIRRELLGVPPGDT